MTRLLLRCDASTSIGTGHFFRMLSLGEAARDQNVDVQLACSALPPGLVVQADESDVPLRHLDVVSGSSEDAGNLTSLTARGESSCIVVDGYHFPPAYYEQLADVASVVAAVDDIGHQPFPVDLLVNVNPGSDRIEYDVPSHCQLLLGLEYALLRRQFRAKRSALEARGGPGTAGGGVCRVLVFLGGGDPTNETVKILKALRLAQFEGHVDILIGPANPHVESVRREAARLRGDARILHNVTSMADVMARQDLALCAAGSISWELACLGIPMVQIVVADNQQSIAEELATQGVTEFVGRREEVSVEKLGDRIAVLLDHPQRRAAMAERAWNLVDGKGAVRVLKALDLMGNRSRPRS